MDSIGIEDKRYPALLKEIAKPPKTLYCMGNINLLQEERKIAVVGSRAASGYGKLCCERLVETLVAADVVTVSGLALGIDAICHRQTLSCSGKTIAVVGCGLDVIYPKANTRLWKEIEERALIISEYPLGTPPYPAHFPERNRIIVGLSKALVVVESKSRGGSLISAEIALEENRDVYAIPGDVDRFSSEGCNALIRDSKAKLLAKSSEILYDYDWNRQEITEILLQDQKLIKIFQALYREKTLEELERETGFSRKSLLSSLMELEIEGFVKAISGGKFKKIK